MPVPVAAVFFDFQLHDCFCYKLDYILNQHMTAFLIGCTTQTTSTAQKYHKLKFSGNNMQ